MSPSNDARQRKLEELEKQLDPASISALQSMERRLEELEKRRKQQRHLKYDVAYYRDAYHAAQQRNLEALKCTEEQRRKQDELFAAKDALVCALQTEVDALRGKMDQLRTLCAAH